MLLVRRSDIITRSSHPTQPRLTRILSLGAFLQHPINRAQHAIDILLPDSVRDSCITELCRRESVSCQHSRLSPNSSQSISQQIISPAAAATLAKSATSASSVNDRLLTASLATACVQHEHFRFQVCFFSFSLATSPVFLLSSPR